jgi:hypothetical protein
MNKKDGEAAMTEIDVGWPRAQRYIRTITESVISEIMDEYTYPQYGQYSGKMGRFVSRFFDRFLRSVGEHMIGALLAILIILLQLRYGVIQKANASGVWWSIIWPYVALLSGLTVWHAGQTIYTLREEDRASVQHRREYAIGQAALLRSFSAEANELIYWLERLQNHWSNCGESLLYPLDMNRPKTLEGTAEIEIELRDFKVGYGRHLVRLESAVPAFHSNTMTGNYPSNCEYTEVLYNLIEHAASLECTALRLSDSGIPLECREIGL